jgi:predicted AAA+ superfamily ATPase
MLAWWTEFISMHILYPLNFSVFLSLLQKLVKVIQNNSVTQEEVNKYLECNMLQIVVLDADFCLTIKT